MDRDTIVLTRTEIESLILKYNKFIEQLSLRERDAMQATLLHIHVRHPRHYKSVLMGGSDGLLLLVNSLGQIEIVRPEGPLPQDFREAIVIQAEKGER